MGKKKRGHPDVEELLARPWCYYCERDFEDLKLLISHQKAKHFKCDRCGKRLNTAGGLSVHMNQVHKESLDKVENALPNRQGLDIEIFGMEGVPDDIVQQHNQRIITNFYTAQAERHAATGNPPPGQAGGQGPAKKIKIETPEELKKRLADHRAKVAAIKANGGVLPVPVVAPKAQPASVSPVTGQSPAQGASPFPPPQPGFPYPPPVGVPGAFPPPGQPGVVGAYPPVYPPPGATPTPPGAPGGPGFNLPARPTGGALPQRPPYYNNYNGGAVPPPGAYPGGASTVDELVSGAARQGGGGAQGDEIDQLIRAAEQGSKAPARAGEDSAGGEKKGKSKDKNMRMVYGDSEVSPEEKMALLPRYAVSAA
ncbi:hypothetical protein GE21DRAFT_1292627 [Neurospora crassa]|uniref:RING-6 n=1 Tax=Neurospora crassa (strain ATCC 24698 / 74-OR23-1A / CBS 708.71 / DSM 1257 / FGSC 987) TaxID=367110 RepID=Q7S5E3_NEUCR|nr:RING-6 [Neurospora crassa OR74A]EAA30771.1 RING-6 [Neurospora crassa OR74A]KHE79119.1 hypothetical protein GE21DRAFT_1292627 [Neurospora crassa]|eukprot:XP_960007.1 RING-6 [Neurospora crassa OR74A]